MITQTTNAVANETLGSIIADIAKFVYHNEHVTERQLYNHLVEKYVPLATADHIKRQFFVEGYIRMMLKNNSTKLAIAHYIYNELEPTPESAGKANPHQ